jgi:long-chain fatty acid transport protein
MTLEGRGARPLGRAGSFVAGADDASAFVYNPAGLADIDGISFLLDGGFVLQRTHYDRVDSGGNPQPGVDGKINTLIFPTVAITWKPRKVPWFTLAGGVWVPYLGLNSYPANGPQRYSNISLDGSLVLVAELAAGFRLHEHVWLGAGFQIMYINFQSTVALSGCTQLNCAPEDPGFDTPTHIDVTGVVPSGVIGATFAWPKIRAGLSLQLPFFIHGDGTVTPTNPHLGTDPFFTNASIVGSSVSADFVIPLMLRLGVEYRPRPTVRVELGADYEAWSMQKELRITPHNIYIDGVPGIGKYYLNSMSVARNMVDSFSVHLGAEWEAVRGRLVVRAGYLFETSATPDAYMSVLTSDGLHNMISLGLATRIKMVRLDLGYAHLFTADRDVGYKDTKSLQLNPIQPSIAVGVGGGHYHIDTDMIALGLDGRW